MQHAPGPLSEQQGEAPLPPALTSPAPGPVAEAETLAAPFVARAVPRPEPAGSALPPVMLPASESRMPWEEGPVPWEEPTEDSPPELAEAVAERLEALAARLRVEGIEAVLRPAPGAPAVDLLLAALLAGYLAR